MVEDVRPADKREQQPIYGAPEVGCMSNVVHVPFRHVPAVQEVQRCKDIAGDRDGNQIDVDPHLGFEQDGCEQDGRNCTRRPHGVVVIVVFVFYEVAYGRNNYGGRVQGYVEESPVRAAEGGSLP